MGSADELVRSFRRREPAHRRDEQPVIPARFAWPFLVISTVCRSILCTAVALMLWAVLPNLVGLHSTMIMSGSMTPGLQVGDAVVVRPVTPAQLSPGQILMFDDPDHAGRLRMHRLVSVEDGRLTTKGDANEQADSSTVEFSAVRGAGFLRVPFAGLPEYWVRTGQPLPLVGAAAAGCLLWAGMRLERLLEASAERSRRRHRGVRLAGAHRAAAGLVVLVVLAGGTLAAGPSTAQASYRSSTATVGSWSLCRDRARDTGLPAPRFSWGYGSSTTAAVPDAPIVTSGTVTAGPDPGAILGSGYTRQSCNGTASPYISLATGKPVILESRATSGRPSAVTIATWFRTTSTNGVIADFAAPNTTTPAGASPNLDRVLYVTADGKVAFGNATTNLAGIVTIPWTCTSTSSVTSASTWHLVVATWNDTTGCQLWLDKDPVVVNAPSAGVTIRLLSSFQGRWRVGYDAIPNSVLGLGVGSTDAPYVGDLDETRVWDSVLSDTDVAKVLSRPR